jgi:hypothetical protein
MSVKMYDTYRAMRPPKRTKNRESYRVVPANSHDPFDLLRKLSMISFNRDEGFFDIKGICGEVPSIDELLGCEWRTLRCWIKWAE